MNSTIANPESSAAGGPALVAPVCSAEDKNAETPRVPTASTCFAGAACAAVTESRSQMVLDQSEW